MFDEPLFLRFVAFHAGDLDHEVDGFAAGVGGADDEVGEVGAFASGPVDVGDAEAEEGVFDPALDFACGGHVVEGLGGAAFPFAVEDDDVDVGMAGGEDVFGGVAVDKAGAAGGVVVVEDGADALVGGAAGE